MPWSCNSFLKLLWKTHH